jgi:hypothetical protein
VPEISRFLGIVIGMFYRDHNPHYFHATYGEHEVAISIEDGRVLWGRLPKRAMPWATFWSGGNPTSTSSWRTGSAPVCASR